MPIEKLDGESPNTSILEKFLRQKQVATMDELKATLKTNTSITVYRTLKKLSYRTSYSHNGRYYALDNSMRFDAHGLWNARSIWFSQHGTLLKTLEQFVLGSANGHFAHELENLLHVGVKESLLRLVQRGAICRERVARAYLYCSNNATARRKQLANRQIEFSDARCQILFEHERVSDEVKAAIILFTALLNEQQRRMFAGIEALQFGREAEKWIAHLLGIHPQTVAKGKKELLDGNVDTQRIRKKGAGRPRVEKKHQKSTTKSKI